MFAVTIPLAATAQADPSEAAIDSFFRSLQKRGVSQYYTPEQALGFGMYLCKGLTAGRDFNSVYSDLVDFQAAKRIGGPAGSLGHVMGAAWNNLCPEFTDIGRTVVTDYIPKGQRG